MATWPVSLPAYPLLAGFTVGAPDTVVRSDPSVGPPLVRQRATAGVRPVQCTVKVGTTALKDALDEFFRVDCAGGALPFEWAGLSASTGGGSGALFLFAAPPDYAPEGATRWRIALQLLRLPA